MKKKKRVKSIVISVICLVYIVMFILCATVDPLKSFLYPVLGIGVLASVISGVIAKKKARSGVCSKCGSKNLVADFEGGEQTGYSIRETGAFESGFTGNDYEIKATYAKGKETYTCKDCGYRLEIKHAAVK